jgi:hypothetical protein
VRKRYCTNKASRLTGAEASALIALVMDQGMSWRDPGDMELRPCGAELLPVVTLHGTFYLCPRCDRARAMTVS